VFSILHNSAKLNREAQRTQRVVRPGTEAHKEGVFGPCVPFRILAMLDIMHSLMRLRAKERGPKSSLNQSLNESLKGDKVRSRRVKCDASALCPLCVLCGE
jgi:hypothetical protein